MTEIETAPSRTSVLDLAGELLALRSRRDGAGLATVALPVGLLGSAAGWSVRQLRAAATVSWEQPSEDLHLFGFGRALDLGSAAGAPLAAAAPALREAADEHRAGDVDPLARPRFFGGARFDASAPHLEHAWEAFGAWRFVLPEVIVALHRGQVSASLTLAVRPQQTREDVASAVAGAIARVALPSGPPAGPPRYQRTGPDASHWRSSVLQALGEIADGRYGKVVLALQARCHSPTPHDVSGTLTALADRYESCYVFGYRLGDSSWVGASPELLVSLEQGRVSALSLAGTCARGRDAEEDEELARVLIASEKERSEHDMVVRAARETLGSLCSELSVPDTPRILRMTGIQHLQTLIEGRADPGVDVLDALLAMHPTPAVGGSPREPALDAIARLEGMDRGWYAGPIGWMDMNGEGAFAVALRAALLHGREALLYAGAGVVAGSDPDRELAEAELKLRPLLEALRGE
ncbi:MAG: isochorismate synthase [Chloroflexota bacterium]|nr:isochorismate synthase [Chloroflexota bacterium]